MLEKIDRWEFVLHSGPCHLPFLLGKWNAREYATHDQEYGYTLSAAEYVVFGKVARIEDIAQQLLVLLAGQMRRGILEDSRGTKGR